MDRFLIERSQRTPDHVGVEMTTGAGVDLGQTLERVASIRSASSGVASGSLTAVLTESDATKAMCYQVLELFAVWPLLSAGLLSLGSGLPLGLGSKYGLIRYWWNSVKLALNLVLTSLVLVLLRSEVYEIAERGRAIQAGDQDTLGIGDLAFPPVVSTTLVLVAMLLSVFKPWGPLRKDQRSARQAGALVRCPGARPAWRNWQRTRLVIGRLGVRFPSPALSLQRIS